MVFLLAKSKSDAALDIVIGAHAASDVVAEFEAV